MCGIVGIASLRGAPQPELALIKKMCDTIIHRGPDEEGTHVTDGVGLGMRRLSIIDLSGGQQPIFNEDRSVRTVFNGEIYNFRELRDNLTSKGHRFSTQCDTEVIVHAYEQYGADFPNYLNGMFAIAVHDMANKKLILARDHLGIKPLFYCMTDQHLIWGSEIKVILESGLFKPELNLDSVSQFLSWEYVPGQQTLIKGIQKLEAGTLLEIDLACSRNEPRIEPRVYWDIPMSDGTEMTTQQWEEAVDSKLSECIRRQLVSDVPLGAFLSGGVDSSLIVAAMPDAKTFSIGFDDPSYNELPFAQAVADHLKVNHTTEIIEPDVVHLFDQLMYLLDDPIGDFSIFPTYLVSKLARQHVKVALSGDGGDELFGGYETYIADDKARQYSRMPKFMRRYMLEPVINSLKPPERKKGLVNKAKRFIEGAALPDALSHTRWRLFMNNSQRQNLFSGDAHAQLNVPVEQHIVNLFDKAGDRGALDRSLYVDVKSYLSDNILTKVDRMSMGVSLETRVPFLDKELVALAFSMPARLKVNQGKTKVLLKQVATRHVPKHCVYRPKEGFSIPIKQWLGTQFRPLMEDLLSKSRISQNGIFDWSTVERLKQEHLRGSANHSHTLWSLMVFEAWKDKWLKPYQ